MSFDPRTYFVGLMDFFSILLPGALLTYAGKDWVSNRMGGTDVQLDGAESVILFLFSSYLVGHLTFLVSSALDDWVYDPLRKKTDRGQIKQLADGDPLSWRWCRSLAKSRWVFGQNADGAVTQVERIKARALKHLGAAGAVNSFQWSKARLSKEHPEGLQTVQRFEADSKFFRSFFLALVILFAFFLARQEWIRSVICFVLLLLALLRYVEQRHKATQNAYWLILTLEGKAATAPERSASTVASEVVSALASVMTSALAPAAASTAAKRTLTHAGGVVHRVSKKIDEYLLIRPSSRDDEWVFPRGHIEPGEDPTETAVREVKEETGHWAHVVRWIDDAHLRSDPEQPFVRFYLMELDEDFDDQPGRKKKGWPPEERQQQWVSMPKPKPAPTYVEAVKLLEQAATLVQELKEAASDGSAGGGTTP